jgi:hypothetical protein
MSGVYIFKMMKFEILAMLNPTPKEKTAHFPYNSFEVSDCFVYYSKLSSV